MPTDGCSIQPPPSLNPADYSAQSITGDQTGVPFIHTSHFSHFSSPRPLLRAILEQQRQQRHRESQQSHGGGGGDDDGGECVVLIAAVVRWETLSLLAPFLPRSLEPAFVLTG